jgi:hypothetical protein
LITCDYFREKYAGYDTQEPASGQRIGKQVIAKKEMLTFEEIPVALMVLSNYLSRLHERVTISVTLFLSKFGPDVRITTSPRIIPPSLCCERTAFCESTYPN